jgi:hypothetical protein
MKRIRPFDYLGFGLHYDVVTFDWFHEDLPRCFRDP